MNLQFMINVYIALQFVFKWIYKMKKPTHPPPPHPLKKPHNNNLTLKTNKPKHKQNSPKTNKQTKPIQLSIF